MLGLENETKTSKYWSIQREMEAELLNNPTLPAMDHNIRVEPHYHYDVLNWKCIFHFIFIFRKQ